MNGSWTSTATVTEYPTKSTTFPSPYTGAAVQGRYMDTKSWAVVGFMGLLWIL
jgi:hypothetical protein